MVGIVVVSHSQKLAEGVVELASLMAPETPMKAAGGMDDGGFGTSFEKITEAVEEVYSEDGVAIFRKRCYDNRDGLRIYGRPQDQDG